MTTESRGDTEDRTEDRARPAIQRSPADHCGRDDVQLHADAEGRGRGAEARHVDDACNTRQRGAENRHPELHLVGLDAGIERRLLVAAGVEHLAEGPLPGAAGNRRARRWRRRSGSHKGTPENVPCPTALNEGGKVNSDSGVPLVMIRADAAHDHHCRQAT